MTRRLMRERGNRPWLRPVLCASVLLAGGCGGSPTESGPLECASGRPAISLGGSISGALEITDRQLADGTFYDSYSLTLSQDEEITLLLTSTELDPFLYLLDESSGVIAVDDDAGGGADARVERSLERGCYVLYANSVTPETGAYTLSATVTAPAE